MQRKLRLSKLRSEGTFIDFSFRTNMNFRISKEKYVTVLSVLTQNHARASKIGQNPTDPRAFLPQRVHCELSELS